MSLDISMKALLESGVHFGHRTNRWDPRMKPYIFTERNGIHIIDLQQTIVFIDEIYNLVRNTVADGGSILFVGTKRQAQETIASEAARCYMPYVNERWLGGTLTNFATIKLSIERMKKMEAMIEDGSIAYMPNKEASAMRRRLAKLRRNLDGLRNMEKKPSLMYVIDPDSETIAVHEANLAGVPVIAIVDTNCDPDPIDFLIPGNDDAIKATKLITSRIADAIIEGREGRQGDDAGTTSADVEQPEDAVAAEQAVVEPETPVEQADDSAPETESVEEQSEEAADEETPDSPETVETEEEETDDD